MFLKLINVSLMCILVCLFNSGCLPITIEGMRGQNRVYYLIKLFRRNTPDTNKPADVRRKRNA